MNDQRGVTMLELILVSAVLGILAVLVSGFYVNRLVDYARSNTLIILQGNTRQALEQMKRDIKSARTIETTNQWPDTNGPSGNQYGWSSNSNSPSTLVLAVPTVDMSGNLQYVDSQHNVLQTNDVIYYISGGALYRRTLANSICLPAQGGSGSVNCGDRTTCPANLATSNCPRDGKVIEDVANMVTSYYDTNNNPTSNINHIYSVGVTLTQSRAAFGKTYTNSLSSRATLRNKQ